MSMVHLLKNRKFFEMNNKASQPEDVYKLFIINMFIPHVIVQKNI